MKIIGCHAGARSRASAINTMAVSTGRLPTVCKGLHKHYLERCDPASLRGARERAPRQAYETVIPRSKRHFAVDKASRLTSYIERLNNTVRQRVSRLVRKRLSSSKKLKHHISAIWLFIHEYNCNIQDALDKRVALSFSSVLY